MSLFEGNVPSFSIESRPGSSYFALVGALDLSTVGRFEGAFDGMLADGDVIFDLSRLTFVDVVGLHALVRVGRAVRERGGHLILRRPCPTLRTLISVLGEDRFPELHVSPGSGGYGTANSDQRRRPCGISQAHGMVVAAE